MYKEKDYDEENVKEVIFFQGIHGRIIKHGEEEIDVDWEVSSRWMNPFRMSPVLVLEKLGMDEGYLDNLNIGDVVVFEDPSAVNNS